MSAVAAIAAPLRAGSWAAGAPVQSGHDACASIPGIAGWALEYVQPLRTWWDELLGDPAGVLDVALGWEGIERTLRDVDAQLRSAAAAAEPLEGRTARLLQLRYADLLPAVRDAADWSGAVAAGVQLASRIVTAVRTFVCELLVDLGRLIDALFGSFSLNPFDKIDDLRELADAAWDAIQTGQRLMSQMFDAFAALLELISRLGPVVDALLVALRETVAEMLPAVGAAVGIVLGAGIPILGPLLGGALGGVLGASFGGAAGDLLMESGDVERYDLETLQRLAAADPDGPAAKKLEAMENAMATGELNDLADLVEANGFTDAMGGSDSTAIDVKLVRAADGSEHWVVSLPSTQEWLDLTGTGAMNDRNGNLALMFLDNPELKTQYERAVLRAMSEAGAAPGDPVVFTGFSQGGIMAANLAADPSLPYRPIGVVTNGSPIDSFDIPADIPVIAFQHENDPVPKLDANSEGATPANVHRVVLQAPAGESGILGAGEHSNDLYTTSVRNQAADLSSEYAWMGGTVVDHQVFVSTQR